MYTVTWYKSLPLHRLSGGPSQSFISQVSETSGAREQAELVESCLSTCHSAWKWPSTTPRSCKRPVVTKLER